MKNMIKMSLVAAVAVAGLSSNVAAKPLEEAIKDVDVSGSVLYRYNDYNNDVTNSSATQNFYKVATTLKSKVNDTVTSAVRVIASNSATGGLTGLSTDSAGDSNVEVRLSHANFTVKTDYATVIAGKQALATPWTVALDSDGDEDTGTGLLALVPAGPVTVAAAYFNQTNLDTGNAGAKNLSTVGVMGKAGPVAIDAWYADQADTLDTFTIGAKGSIEGITINGRYTSLTTDAVNASGNDKNSLTQVKVSSKIGPVGVWGQLAMTDKDGGTTALENSAKTAIEGWNIALNGKRDADYIGFGAGMDVISGLNVALNYRAMDYKATLGSDVETEEYELYTQITHKMGKNLVTYVRFGNYEKETSGTKANDDLRGRLQVEYKF